MNDIPVTKWSVDHVCAWVGAQNFRAYKHIFREGLISGRTLLALDHPILEVRVQQLTIPISCRYHSHKILLLQKLRISEHTHSMRYNASAICNFNIIAGMEILFAIEDLKGSDAASGSRPQLSLATRGDQYDVFLSYRRVGGAGIHSIIAISSKICSNEPITFHFICRFRPITQNFAESARVGSVPRRRQLGEHRRIR